jgi:hypothetical protein
MQQTINKLSFWLLLTTNLIILLLAGHNYYRYYLANRPQTAQAQQQQLANRYAQTIDQSLQQIRQQLANAAQRPFVLKALTNASPFAISSAENQLAYSFPYALSILLVPLDASTHYQQGTRTLSLVERNMVIASQQGQQPDAQLVVRNQRPMLVFTHPVQNTKDKQIATLLVRMDIRGLLSKWHTLNPALSDFQVLSTHDADQPLVIFLYGDSEGQQVYQARLDHPDWQLEYRPPAADREVSFHWLGFIWPYVFALVLNSLIILWLRKRANRLLSPLVDNEPSRQEPHV